MIYKDEPLASFESEREKLRRHRMPRGGYVPKYRWRPILGVTPRRLKAEEVKYWASMGDEVYPGHVNCRCNAPIFKVHRAFYGKVFLNGVQIGAMP